MFCASRIKCLRLFPLLVFLGGCLSAPTRPDKPAFDNKAVFTVPIPPAVSRSGGQWWEKELKPDYRTWVVRLLGNNPAIRLAAAETVRQRARRDEADADRGGSLELNAGSRIDQSDGARSVRHSAGIDARLPLDLSGELTATYDARAWEHRQALANLEQTRLEQTERLLLALLDYAESRQRRQLLHQQLTTTQKQLHLTEIRFAQGQASSVDVLQQREQIASLRQQLPGIHNDARLAANRITELLGQPPDRQPAFPHELPEIPSTLPPVKPFDLLRFRPDLLAQQAALAAADAEFEAALRARLPGLALSGSALWQLVSGNPSAVIEAALDASLTLFDGGANKARIEQKRAGLRKAGVRYLQTWLAAVRKVDDLLNTQHTQEQELQQTRKRLQIGNQLYRGTLSRYQRGITDYLPVLTAVRDLQRQQREALHLETERQRTLVRLKIAIGLPPDRDAS